MESDEIDLIFSRLIKDLNDNLKNEQNTDENDNIFNESGSYFDYNMFYVKNYNQITKPEAKYFLTISNYDYEESTYEKKLKALFEKRNSKTKGYTFRQNRSINALSIGKCAWVYRNFK